MPDPRFFRREKPKSLGELAALTGAAISQGSDPALLIEDVAPLDQAGAGTISFLDNVKYKDQFAATKAAACIIASPMAEHAPKGISLLLTEYPYKTYARIAQSFYPDFPQKKPATVKANNLHVHPDANVGKGCVLEHNVSIAAGAEIGDGCWIGANAVVGENVVIGRECRVGANTVISHSLIGDHVRIYPGCCIGQDGFGFAIDPAGHIKVPQLGRVIIEDSVEIGANTTIDRGSGPDTVVGQGTWIDNLVQIGHNVKIGKGCVIVSQVGISGSTVVEDYVMMAGQAGIAGHLHIGKGARIGAKAGVMRDVPAGEQQLGSPAIPARQFMRQVAAISRLVEKDRK
ncbi:MAG TPA: UDP-3-O-(3-hydroxymyristoyl)glucosamine N-acyltransferase [Patescibacteria group bacterium]|nr:UDP-3-O-(3-hydroxymyristoyl)glucosamine N-acyltransferase [Patescibacteria group bacterium]